MKTIKYVSLIIFLIGLFYMEASKMFIVETSIQASIIYPLVTLSFSFLLINIGRRTFDKKNRGLLFLVIWLYVLSVFHSGFKPLPAKYCYISLILPAICLYLPQKFLQKTKGKHLFDLGNIIVFLLLLSYYFFNYQNNVFVEVKSQNNAAYILLFYSPILLCINNKYIRYVTLFLTGFALLFSLKRSGIAAFVLGLVAFFYATLKSSYHTNKLMYLLLVCLGLFGIFELSQNLLGDRTELLVNRFLEIENSGGSGREEIYQATWGLIMKNNFFDYLLGHGYGGVLRDSPYECSAHNDYLEFTYDYGIIGLILLICYMVKFGKMVFFLIQRKSQFAAPAAFTFVIVAINSFFSHVFYYEWYLLLIAIFWGYLMWNVTQEEALKSSTI